MVSSSHQDLWGGAITVNFPSYCYYCNVSDLRQAPDHQEIFIEMSNVKLPKILIFEIVQWQTIDSVDASVIGNYFWNDIMHDNEAEIHQVSHVNEILKLPIGINNNTTENRCIQVEGAQIVKSKMNENNNNNDYELVALHVTIIRLPKVNSEIIISIYDPTLHMVIEHSNTLQISKDTTRQELIEVLSLKEATTKFEALSKLSSELIESMQIHNWQLFLPTS